MRPYLVYVSSRHDWPVPPTWRNPARTFDLCLVGYDRAPLEPTAADMTFHSDLEKFRGAKAVLGSKLLDYEAVTFLDDDIELTATDLTACFREGLAHGWKVWQPALTPDSFYSWKCTVQQVGKSAETTEFVEVMMPFFSRAGLAEALPTFSLNYGAFGLDVLWSSRTPREQKGILHHLSAGHHRSIGSSSRLMPNGKTKLQELDELLRSQNLLPYWNRLCKGIVN